MSRPASREARKISAAAPAASAGERAKPAHRHARRSGRVREGSAAQRWLLLDHGCRVCIQSAAACALLAAVKIARGSSLQLQPGGDVGRVIGSRFVRDPEIDRKSVVSGKSVSVRVDLGGRRIIKKNKSNSERNVKQQK